MLVSVTMRSKLNSHRNLVRLYVINSLSYRARKNCITKKIVPPVLEWIARAKPWTSSSSASLPVNRFSRMSHMSMGLRSPSFIRIKTEELSSDLRTKAGLLGPNSRWVPKKSKFVTCLSVTIVRISLMQSSLAHWRSSMKSTTVYCEHSVLISVLSAIRARSNACHCRRLLCERTRERCIVSNTIAMTYVIF